MNIRTVGVDLAKTLFQVHGVDERGKAVVRKQLKRAELVKFFVNRPPCLKLMAPQFVKPYVKTNKNDARDAEAICEALARPNVSFVPVKNVEQQAAY